MQVLIFIGLKVAEIGAGFLVPFVIGWVGGKISWKLDSDILDFIFESARDDGVMGTWLGGAFFLAILTLIAIIIFIGYTIAVTNWEYAGNLLK